MKYLYSVALVKDKNELNLAAIHPRTLEGHWKENCMPNKLWDLRT